MSQPDNGKPDACLMIFDAFNPARFTQQMGRGCHLSLCLFSRNRRGQPLFCAVKIKEPFSWVANHYQIT